MSNQERRQFVRRPLRTRAALALPDKHPVEVRTIDISMGGMAVALDTNPLPGTTYLLSVALPGPSGQTPLEARAKVMHSVLTESEHGFKVGLSFVELSLAASAAINGYLT